MEHFLPSTSQTGASQPSPGGVIPSVASEHVADDPDFTFYVSIDESNVGR